MKFILPAVSTGCIFVACFTTLNPIVILPATVGLIAFFLGCCYDKYKKVFEKLLEDLDKKEETVE